MNGRGICETHGSWELDGYNCPGCEIARLRAEVEKERAGKRSFHALMQQVERERDEAQANLERISERFHEVEHREQIALAQVAVLAAEAQKVVDNHDEGFSCQDGVAQNLPALLKNIPVEARALLDQLHALEDQTAGFPCGCVVILKEDEPPVFTPGGCHTRLQRAEAENANLREQLRGKV